MINEPTTPTSVTNQTVTPTSINNLPIPTTRVEELWMESVLPWQLDLIWEYEPIIKSNTEVTNL